MRNCRQSRLKCLTAVVRTASRATALVATLCCCGSASHVPAQTTSAFAEVDRVRGVVINSVTREPVSRAVVYSPDNAFATMTDDRGRFEFVFRRPEPETTTSLSGPSQTQSDAQSQIANRYSVNIANRPSQLIARKIGYLPATEATDISQINPAQKDVTMVLVPESRIIGQVVIPGWDGSQKTQLQVFRRAVREGHEYWDGVGNASTRANGEFRIAGLALGSYKLLTLELMDRDPLAFRPGGPMMGYPPLYFPSASDFESAGVIHLVAGETFQATLSPVKKPYYPVKVGITNVLETPQVGVTVFPQGRPGPGFSLGYNQQDGEIQGALPDGTYTLLVTSYGQNMLAGTTNITVRGSPLSGVSVGLLPGSSISLNVREEFQRSVISAPENVPNSQPPAYNPKRSNYLQVTLMPEEQFSLATPVSLSQPRNPEDESLTIENVRPGRYRVAANNSGVGYIAAVTSGGRDLLREALVVGAGSSLPPLEIVVRDDGAEVNGTIELPTNSPGSAQPGQANRVVYLLSLDRPGDQPRIAIADLSGAFSMPQVPPGSYQVVAFDRQREELDSHNDELLKQYESRIQIIRVAAEQKLHLRVPLIVTNE